MKPVCKISNLKKVYHDLGGEILAVSRFNLEVKPGEFVAIVGPSGCGKSTILSILAGIEEATEGTIKFSKDNPRIGYMFQNDILFSWLNVENNANLGLDILKDKNLDRDYALQLLKDYGLEKFIDKYPSSLSGGMKQRVLRMH